MIYEYYYINKVIFLYNLIISHLNRENRIKKITLNFVKFENDQFKEYVYFYENFHGSISWYRH